MDYIFNTPDCLHSRSTWFSLSSVSHSRSSAQYHQAQSYRPRRTTILSASLYQGLLILILTFYLSPCLTLAQSAPNAFDISAQSPTMVSEPHRKSTTDNPHGDTLIDNNIKNLDGMSTGATRSDRLLLPRQIATASNTSTTKMPTPYDTLSNNFANSSCVDYFEKFLSNSSVIDCYAVSLLLQNSNSFFHTLTSAAETSYVLDTACSVKASSCASIMSWVATEMLSDDTCGAEYASNNSVVTGAYADLMAYEPMYSTTCLTNPDTNDYCFVDAVQNTTAPNDYNVYFIPLGTTLGAGELTCNKCLQATMETFAHWATIDGQVLDKTYIPSAKQVNEQCGDSFANVNITVGTDDVKASAGLTVPNPQLTTSICGLALGAILIGLF